MGRSTKRNSSHLKISINAKRVKEAAASPQGTSIVGGKRRSNRNKKFSKAPRNEPKAGQQSRFTKTDWPDFIKKRYKDAYTLKLDLSHKVKNMSAAVSRTPLKENFRLGLW